MIIDDLSLLLQFSGNIDRSLGLSDHYSDLQWGEGAITVCGAAFKKLWSAPSVASTVEAGDHKRHQFVSPAVYLPV